MIAHQKISIVYGSMRLLGFLLIVSSLGPHLVLAAEKQVLLRIQEAGAALVRGHYDKAVGLYDEALKGKDLATARKASIYNDRGVAKWRLGQRKKAIADFNKAIQAYPEFGSAYNNRGNVLFELGYPQEAIKDINRAISLAPAYGPAYNNRGNAHLKLGKNDAAVRDYVKAIELMPTNAVPFNGRGKAHLGAKRYHASIRDFSRAITLNAKYVAAYINRAQAYVGLKQYRKAIADLSFVITSKPNEALYYSRRGQVHRTRKRYGPALRDYAKAIKLDSENALALTERGAMHAETKEYDAALEDLSRAIENEPGLAAAYVERAFAYLQMGTPETGLADAEKAVEFTPLNPRAYAVRAKIYEKTGQTQQAIADLRKALKLKPQLESSREALERLTGEVTIAFAETIGEPLEGWQITKSASGQYIASNTDYSSITVSLEMYGPEKPQLLEWTALKQSFRGIGLLRYYAGSAKLSDKARVESIAVIDLYNKKVAAIEPFRWGSQKAKWDWKDGKVIVTDHEGTPNKIKLRKPRYVARDSWGNEGNWWQQPEADWQYENGNWRNRSRYNKPRRRRKKKSFFDLLFQ